MPVAVEQVEIGDRVMCWFPGWDLAEPLIVTGISEGKSWRTLHADRNGEPFDMSVPRGRTVDLAC